MSYAVLCPDGVDRLKVRWATRREAEDDARYFGPPKTFGCASWCYLFHEPRCPGGAHYVGEEPEPLLAWAVDLSAA